MIVQVYQLSSTKASPADNFSMVLTWLFLLLTALIFGILAILSFFYAKKVQNSVRDHNIVLGVIKRRQGLRAIIEWNARGETYVVAPIGLFSLRKKAHIRLLMDPRYVTKATVDHWTTNGKIWMYTSYLLSLLSIICVGTAIPALLGG